MVSRMRVRWGGWLVIGLSWMSLGVAAEAPVSKGNMLVTTVCAACHGADGNSVITANPKLAGQHPEYLAKQIRDFKSGERNNPVMAGMAAMLATPEDIAEVATLFAAQASKGGSAKSHGAGSEGEQIYRGGALDKGLPACASCHGAGGAGIPARFPRLAGQHAEYTLIQMKAFRAGERGNAPMMRMIAAKMTDQEMAAVADYIQGLK